MSETTQPVSAAEVAQAITEQSDAFEKERARRAKALDARQARWQKRIIRALLWSYFFLVAAFLFLAWRTETNTGLLRQQARATDQRFYQACIDRRDRQIVVNVGREEFVQLVISRRVPAPVDGERAQLEEQLRAALLVPVEECGDPPPPAD